MDSERHMIENTRKEIAFYFHLFRRLTLRRSPMGRRRNSPRRKLPVPSHSITVSALSYNEKTFAKLFRRYEEKKEIDIFLVLIWFVY